MEQPWEHPDWYDLHDTTWTAGPEREPEHYRETILALPPLDAPDHLIDVGAGTGKLALQIAKSYPRLGQVTLLEPNAAKLERAQARLRSALPAAEVHTLALGVGAGAALPQAAATVATIGSVLMPILELRDGTLADGLAWLRAALADVYAMLQPGGWMYDVETLAAPWSRGALDEPVRRLSFPELLDEFGRAGFDAIECVYRFRDRVAIKARRPAA
jgi:SAM-dependent methyltransferase